MRRGEGRMGLLVLWTWWKGGGGDVRKGWMNFCFVFWDDFGRRGEVDGIGELAGEWYILWRDAWRWVICS